MGQRPAAWPGAASGRSKHPARVSNHADLDATNPGMTGDDLFGIVCLKLVQMAFIKQTIKNRAHVVRLAVIRG